MSTNYLNGQLFDYSFIVGSEGTTYQPYYPGTVKGKLNVRSIYSNYSDYHNKYTTWIKSGQKSGVSIATGLDIAYIEQSVINAISNSTQRSLLSTARGLTKEKALDWIWNNQTNFGTLSSSDCSAMMNEYFRLSYSSAKRNVPNIESLDYKLRTALIYMIHSGPGTPYFTRSIKYFRNADVSGLIAYLGTITNSVLKIRANTVINYIKGLVTVSSYDQTLKTKEELNDEDSGSSSYDTYSLAIGNEWVLSNYNNSQATINYFTNILKKSEISEDVISEISKAFGLFNEDAIEYANNSNINLTNAQSDKLFTNLMFENLTRMQDFFGYKLQNHPIEVNSAIMSYIFDTNLNDTDIVNDEIKPIMELLNSKKYNDLANFIETHGFGSRTKYNGAAVNIIGELDRLISRRTKEANLIRARKSDKPDYPANNVSSEIGDPDTYFSSKHPHQDALDAENAKKQALYAYRAFANNNYANTDETYSEVTREVADNYAEMYQIHQVTTDGISVDGEGDYEYRLRIKRFYNLETRSKNLSYFQIEKQVQDEGGDTEQLASSYAYVPYGNNMFQDIKKNAVSRCQYRIKKLKKKLGEITEEVTSYGIFDMGLTTEDLILLSITVPAIGIALAILQALFGDYTTTQVALNEEEKNLKYLLREQARFTKTNSSN